MPSSSPGASDKAAGQPVDRRTIRSWQRYLADEYAEAAVYRDLAERRDGEERDILLQLAEAEGRHAEHWRQLLRDHGSDGSRYSERAGRDDVRASAGTRVLGFLARHVGSVVVLALAQRAERRSPYATDEHATDTMAADERIHGEVVRGLAARGRSRLSGTFRAAVFGANDGLVSNLALVLAVGAAGASTRVVLLTGLAGLLAGALSMGAGEYVSVRSQRELLAASIPDPHAAQVLPHLDVDANELALVYRARGLSEEAAAAHAREVLAGLQPWTESSAGTGEAASPSEATDAYAAAGGATDANEAIGTAGRVAISSFFFFASGAIIPVVPYLIGVSGLPAQVIAAALVGVALLLTGAVVGVLSGAPPLRRALRQLAIGYGAAAATYLLGLLFAT